MKRIAPFSLAGLVAAGMLIATPALANMNEADTNADGQIDQTELEQSLSISIQSMDTDGDGQIGQSEFESATGGAITFSDLDSNGDGSLDQQELSQGLLTRYDTDADQQLNEDEYTSYEQEFGTASGMSSDSTGTEADTAATTGLESDSDLGTSSGLETDSGTTTSTGLETDTDISASSDYDSGTDLSGSGSMGGGLAGYAAEDVMGADVIGASGDSIGEVSDLVLDSNDQVSDVIVDVGGFLGIGSQSVALPASDVQINQGEDGNIQISTNYSEDELEQMGEYEDMEGDDYRLYSSERVETDVDAGTTTAE